MELNLLPENAVLLFDKPYQWTSFNLVSKVKSQLKYKFNNNKIKVGHAGTLDPLATGLLIVCVGKATKTIDKLQGLNKEYIASIKFGATTPSFDLERAIDQEYPWEHINAEKIKKTLSGFLGEQEQIPPVFSAVWIDGHRAYKTAHKGGNIDMPGRMVTFEDLDLLEYNAPLATIRIVCSKGTYIRSFARDLGEKMQSGAHLINLRRTRVGDFFINDAYTLENFNVFLNSYNQL